MANTTPPALLPRTITEDSDWHLPIRLTVKRSGIFGNLAVGAPKDEIAAQITDSFRAALPRAIEGVNAELLIVFDLPDDRVEDLLDEIRQFMNLAGGNWQPERVLAFTKQALNELGEWPVSLVLPAIAKARQTIYSPPRFIPWIVERIEGQRNALVLERDRLLELQALADQPKD